MQVDGIEGEVFSKVLYRWKNGNHWSLSDNYYSQVEAVRKDYSEERCEIRFPIAVFEEGWVIWEK